MANREERTRIVAVTVAIAQGYGVFANDLANAARLFGDFLLSGGPFPTPFGHVTFTVLDWQGETVAAFADVFRGRCDW